MEKRGSHVGIILSFVVFILFVSFLLVVFRPIIKVQQDKELALEYLEKEFVNLSTAELASVALYIDAYDPMSVKCFSINHPENFKDYNSALVKEGENNLIGSSKLENTIDFDVLANQHFFKIYYSNEELNNENLINANCETLAGGDFDLGLISKKDYIFESKIEELIANPPEELEDLVNSDFNFNFTYSNGTSIWTEEINDVSTNIYIKKIPIQYVDDQANIKSGYLSIGIW